MIETLARQAIEKLKSDFKLPNSGFLAGGSLANLIWELKSGNKAIINDIDIFILDQVVELDDNKIKSQRYNKYTFTKSSQHIIDDNTYDHVLFKNRYNCFVRINSAQRDDMLNYIHYESNTNDYSIIIESFDINCTQVGYDIEADRFIWTKEFEEFIAQGDLKVINANTPAHTSIRLVKKAKDLNANLNKRKEFGLLVLSMLSKGRSYDIIRTKFSDKYCKLYLEHHEDLKDYFGITSDSEASTYLKRNKNVDVKVYKLILVNQVERDMKLTFNAYNSISTLDELKCYYNLSSKDLELYGKIRSLYSLDLSNYVDYNYDEKDLELLERVRTYAPKAIKNLKGLKMSQQISIINQILNRYQHDPVLGGSILEKVKLDPNKEFDADEQLIMELMVRKEESRNSNKRRFDYLFNGQTEKKSTLKITS